MKRVTCLVCVLGIAIFCMGIVGTNDAMAASAKEVAKAAINYPANLVNESVKTVGNAAKNTTDVVVDTVKVTGETVTGDVTKAPEIVTTPIKGSVNTIGGAAKETVETPVRAGEATKDQM